MRIIDISRKISTGIAVWPGDTPFSFRHELRIAGGAAYNLTRISMSPHTGSHADAPWHFDDMGLHPAALPLEPYVGRARVVSVSREQGGIVPGDLASCNLNGMERLLLRTWVSDVADEIWPGDFPYPTVELVDFLADRGLVLLGTDLPSMDARDSRDLPCHHRLAARGISTLENLALAGVPDGIYELIALPLKFDHLCGSPVRAVLRTLGETRGPKESKS
jgi:arylformamidase